MLKLKQHREKKCKEVAGQLLTITLLPVSATSSLVEIGNNAVAWS